MNARDNEAPTYYDDTAPPAPARPPLAGEAICDVCVVGAGYTGLSAALHLAERGYRVAVLERARVGWDASGRNGGQILSGYAADMLDLADRFGQDEARRLWDLAEEGRALLHDRIARHDIACELAAGALYTAAKPRHLRRLEREAALWERFGYRKARILGPAEVGDFVASPLYCGGLFDAGGGHLHPLDYARGLARAAERAGATIYEGSEVTAIEGRDGAKILRSPAGRMKAAQVALCANAGIGSIAPGVERRIMPVSTRMAATARLGEAGTALIPAGVAVASWEAIPDYYRLSADGRLLFGSGASYWGRRREDGGAALRRRMRRVFPQIGEPVLDRVWTGTVAITADRMPYLGRNGRSVWFAAGFSGHGVVIAGLAGKLLAEAISGCRERFDVLARIPHPPFPGGPLRSPLLALAMTWYRLSDLW